MTESLRFNLFIDCDNEAFAEDPKSEISRILRMVAKRLDNDDPCNNYRDIFDSNGNSVGQFVLKHAALL
jgi:hypothetical protein